MRANASATKAWIGWQRPNPAIDSRMPTHKNITSITSEKLPRPMSQRQNWIIKYRNVELDGRRFFFFFSFDSFCLTCLTPFSCLYSDRDWLYVCSAEIVFFLRRWFLFFNINFMSWKKMYLTQRIILYNIFIAWALGKVFCCCFFFRFCFISDWTSYATTSDEHRHAPKF